MVAVMKQGNPGQVCSLLISMTSKNTVTRKNSNEMASMSEDLSIRETNNRRASRRDIRPMRIEQAAF